VAGYSRWFHQRLLKNFQRHDWPVSRIVRKEVVWSDVTFPFKDQYLKRQFGTARSRVQPIRQAVQLVQPSILDILYYVKSKGAERSPDQMKVLTRLHQKVCQAKAEGVTDMVLWAHSLGSVVAFDYVFRFSKLFTFPESISLKALVTFGSPIPFFAASMGYPYSRVKLPSNVKRWVNFWDPDDPIACRCEPHFPKGVVSDVQVETASFVRPDRAHLAYWKRAGVIRQMVDAVVKP